MLFDDEGSEKPKKKPVKRAMCKLMGNPEYYSAYEYGSRWFAPRVQLDFNYGYMILEQEG